HDLVLAEVGGPDAVGEGAGGDRGGHPRVPRRAGQERLLGLRRARVQEGTGDQSCADTGCSEGFLHSSGFLFVCFVCRVSGWPSVSSIPSASKANLAIC